MIAGEILHHAAEGISSFLILQPFGCLPNHVTGRGLIKKLKELYPHVQILSLDYDPDTSFANIENRLQMLILNSRLAAGKAAAAGNANEPVVVNTVTDGSVLTPDTGGSVALPSAQ